MYFINVSNASKEHQTYQTIVLKSCQTNCLFVCIWLMLVTKIGLATYLIKIYCIYKIVINAVHVFVFQFTSLSL